MVKCDIIIEDKRNDQAIKGLFDNRQNDDIQAKELAEKRRQQLRQDLKKQIKDKKNFEEQQQREADQIQNYGLPIGVDNLNRYERYRDAHKAALKEQIEEKAKQRENDKELDKRMQDQYTQETKDYMRQDQERREAADAARKDHYRKEMDRFKDEKDSKKRREEDDKARDAELDQINKARQREEEDRKLSAVRNREDAHRAALKDQMEDAAIRKVNCFNFRNLRRKRERNIKCLYSRLTRSASYMTVLSVITCTLQTS